MAKCNYRRQRRLLRGAGAGPHRAPHAFQHQASPRPPSVGTSQPRPVGSQLSAEAAPVLPTLPGREAAARPGPSPRPAPLPGFRQPSHTDINPFGAHGSRAPLAPEAKTPFSKLRLGQGSSSRWRPSCIPRDRSRVRPRARSIGANAWPAALSSRRQISPALARAPAPLWPLHMSHPHGISSAAGSSCDGGKETFGRRGFKKK